MKRSVELASQRLPREISESDIREYNRLRTDWEDACKGSFGPLQAEDALPRQEPTDSGRAA